MPAPETGAPSKEAAANQPLANVVDILAKLTFIPGATFEKPESKMESNNGNAGSKWITSAKAIQEDEEKFFVMNGDWGVGAANRLLWESNFKVLQDKNQTSWDTALDGIGNMNERTLCENL